MNSSCPICLDLFDGHDIVATPCGHVFHSKCICKWVDSSKFCPECRAKVTRNNILKLFFNTTHSETLPLYPCVQNELDSKKAELKEKEAELAASNKKIKDLQRHAADTEQLYHSMYQKYLASQSEVDILKLRLKNELEVLEKKGKNLKKENLILQSQVNQFNNIQTILQGTQHEAEEILHEQGIALVHEVGVQIAKNMANLCSILKRELCKVKAQREQAKKTIDDLLKIVGLKDAKLKKLQLSQEELQKLLKNTEASPSPVAVVTCRNPDFLPNSIPSLNAMQMTPVSTNSANRRMPLATNSTKDGETSEITPITINFSERKGPQMKKVVLNKLTEQKVPIVNPISRFPKPVLAPLKRKPDIDEDSIMRVGYNGLGSHERVIFARSREHTNPKPYKKNPNVKKAK